MTLVLILADSERGATHTAGSLGRNSVIGYEMSFSFEAHKIGHLVPPAMHSGLAPWLEGTIK